MPISFRTAGPSLLALALALPLAASAQEPAPTPRINAGETVNVDPETQET